MRMRHIVICGLSGSTIFFPHYLINGTIFGGEGGSIQHEMCWFSLQLLYENFLIISRTERDMIKNVYWSSCDVNRYSCPILMTLEFSRRIFENNYIKFHENPSSVSRVVSCGRTDTTKVSHDFANAPKSEQYTVSTTQWAQHSEHYTVNTIQWALYSENYIVSTIQWLQWAVYSEHYTVSTTQWALHSEHYTVSTTQWTLYSEHYTVRTIQWTLSNKH